MKQEAIKFNKQKRDELQKAYNRAVMNGDESFIFDDKQFYTVYAKYLLEYLNTII